MLEEVLEYLQNRKDYLLEVEFDNLIEQIRFVQGEDERRSKESDVFKEKGNLAYKSGDLEASIDYYTSALKIDKNNIAARSNRALVYHKSNNIEMAVDDCLQGIKLDKSFIKFYIRLTTIYEKDNPALALKYAKEGLKIDPSNGILKELVNSLPIDDDIQDTLPSNEELPFDMKNLGDMEKLLGDKNIQDYVKNFVKDKSPDELATMMKDMMGSLNMK